MVLGKRIASRGKRVSLKRSGSNRSLNRRKDFSSSAKKMSIQLPWPTLSNFFSFLGIATLSLVIVATLSFFLTYGYRFVTNSDYFLLKTIAIQGNKKVSSREILNIAGIDNGANLLNLSIDTVEDTLSHNPWVNKVSVARVLPETLKVTVQIKDPYFWLLHNGTLYYADIKGKMIAPLDPSEVSALPILEVEKGAEHTQESLPDLLSSLKEVLVPLGMGKISAMRLSASRGVEFFVEGSRLKITVGLEEWLPSLERLRLTIADLIRRGELKRVRSIRAQDTNVWVETSGEAVKG